MKSLGLVWTVVGMALLGCTGGPAGDSGQTGSTSCALPCRCTYLTDYTIAKATVRVVEKDRVTIHVDQLLSSLLADEQYDQQEITGTFEQQFLCRMAEPTLPRVGDEVLVSFAVDNYEDAGRVLLRTQPWSDEYQLIDGSVVSLTEALRLAAGQTCPQQFAPPCKDTR